MLGSPKVLTISLFGYDSSMNFWKDSLFSPMRIWLLRQLFYCKKEERHISPPCPSPPKHRSTWTWTDATDPQVSLQCTKLVLPHLCHFGIKICSWEKEQWLASKIRKLFTKFTLTYSPESNEFYSRHRE